MSGQTLTDRIAAAQYTLTGSDVSRAVCKATTHEQTPPKKKHMEFLIQATQETNVNVPQMADTLMERAGNASWVVVFKALITTHHLMVHGNERFLQFLASRNTLFNLSNFLDKTGSHGYDMSTFIRRYSRYLNEKAFAYRQMAFDFGRVKKGAEGVMRTMTVEKLLKGMPTLQSQIDALLDFDVHPKDLDNPVINACFLLLFKDLIKLYACYNDGIINLLEKFFQMKRSQCKDGLEIYKRFLTRMTRVSEFFKIAEQVGIDKNDIPELTQAPESLLESLETHLNTLEGKKPEDKSPTKQEATANNSSPAAAAPPAKPAPPAAAGGPPARPGPPAKPPPPSVTPTALAPAAAKAASNALDDGFLLDLDPISSSSAGGAAAASSMTGWGDLLAEGDGPAAVAAGPAADAFGGSDSFASPAPAAEAAPVTVAAAAPIPEASSPPKAAEPAPVIDLLDSFGGAVEETQQISAPGGPGDDLLGGLMSPTLAPTAAPALAPALAPAPVQGDLLESGFDALGSLSSPAPPVPAAVAAAPIVPAALEPVSTTPAPSGGFDASMFDGLGDLLMPAVTPQSTGGSTAGSTGGSMATPVAAGGIAGAPPATPPPTKTIGGDLDSSLANLIGDLGVKKKDPMSEKKLTGGANWMPQVAPTSWGTPGAPMAGAAPGAPGAPGAAPPAMVPPMAAQPGFGMPPAGGPGAPMMQPMMGQPMMGQPLMRPPFTGVAGAAPGAAAPGAPLSPGPASQSPKKPKDPLADLDLKDFL
ncbi:phosphatidylinositol-binding clathrin assembly protein LAP isoform X18 [Acanthopagrus latus]|uniref:phosphatidylinositol-binding clathrin assembly protein LAP isoform X18 n=1 Tax=Acanthopagrus latus TaxID=8177 RepID=UPI00187CF15A|nr:phosphatidylinositol-binding clathrin assembly protein LAP isoform X18 [Acanthopagrus latus]